MRARFIVASVSIAALLGAAACTTTDPYQSGPVRNNTGSGAIAGALGGALLGYLTNTSNGEQGRKNALIGAGVGASRLHVSNYDYVNPLPYGKGTKGSHSNDSNWSFSWALMAGLGYQVTENLVIDAGYRFLNLGDAKTSVKVGPKGKVDFKDIQAHEFRVGFRYLIN